MRIARAALACALFTIAAVPGAGAQSAVRSAVRIAEGRVLRPSSGALGGRPVPVAGQWVVLHRVGSDRAGPLDSARSGPDGRFRIRYSRSGVEDALYFVSARYGDIAYFSPPLRADTVRGGDADVIVYDTTTDTTQLRVQGHHIVLSAPRGPRLRGGRREVAEVFEIENEGTRTVVARDSITPLWTTTLPAEAESTSVAPGDVTAGAVAFRRGRAELFAPMSPGVRQVVLTYLLPASAFPISRPIERQTSVLEVLLEEPRASAEGPRLTEVAPVEIEGRAFRRFLAQDVPASAVIRLDVPPQVAQNRSAMYVLAAVVGLALLGGLAAWYARRHQRFAATTLHPTPAPRTLDLLVAELATLDARFERSQDASVDVRASYERERADLKDRIARELAAGKQSA